MNTWNTAQKTANPFVASFAPGFCAPSARAIPDHITVPATNSWTFWPSKFNDNYSVRNCPWRNGEGDLLKEFADACRAEGLKVGIYLSPWDRNQKDNGNILSIDVGFELQAQQDVTWKTITSGTTIGPAKAISFTPVTAREFRLNILKADDVPTIYEFDFHEQK